jgi:hypothetical protein
MCRPCRVPENHGIHGARNLHGATYYPVQGANVKEYRPDPAPCREDTGPGRAMVSLPGLSAFPDQASIPTDPDHDGICENLNGNRGKIRATCPPSSGSWTLSQPMNRSLRSIITTPDGSGSAISCCCIRICKNGDTASSPRFYEGD